MTMIRKTLINIALALLVARCGEEGTSDRSSEETARAESETSPAPPLMSADAPTPGTRTPAPAAPSVSAGGVAEPLRVVASAPQGPIAGPVRPTITFSKPVKALGALDDSALDGSAVIEPAIEGAWRWLGSTTLEFVPKGAPALSSGYMVTVGAGLRASDGGILPEDHSFEFETPRVAPFGGDPVDPWSEFAWAKPDQVFHVRMNQRPDRASFTEHVLLRGPKGDVAVSILKIESFAEIEAREREKAAEENPESRLPQGPVGAFEGNADRRHMVTLVPAEPLTLGTEWNLAFEPGLTSSEGPLPATASHAWRFRTYGPLTVVQLGCHEWHGACPDGPLSIKLKNPVTARQLQSALRIAPEVEVFWEEDGAESESDTWTLRGKFAPGSTYRVTVAESLTDIFGQKLGHEHSGTFKTGDFGPSLENVVGDRALIERGLREAVPLRHVNVDQVDVEIARLTPDEALRYVENPWWKEAPAPAGVTRESRKLPGVRNQWLASPLDLAKTFGLPGPPGRLAWVSLNWQEGKEKRDARAFVQITDLGVHLKVSPQDSRVFVWRLSDGSPVEGAQVDLYDEHGQRVAGAQSGADGLARLPGAARIDSLPVVDKWGSPLYGPPYIAARATLGDDVAYTSTSDSWNLSPWHFGASEAWESKPPIAEGLVFADRGIYRPGEKVYVKGILRERRMGALTTPNGREITVALKSPENKVLQTKQQTLSRYGGFDTFFELPADGRLGSYPIEVSAVGEKLSWQTSVKMAEYRPPEFQVEVKATSPIEIRGAKLGATVEGRYLFGAAMAGAELSWSVHAGKTTFEPKDARGYVFGRRPPWWLWSEENDALQFIANGQWTLDDTGHFTVDAGKSETPEDRPWRYSIEAAVTDVNRQVLGGRTAITVHPASFYVGLKGPPGFASSGQPFDVGVIAVDALTERPVSASKVRVALIREVWHSIRKRNLSGRFETITEERDEEVASCEADVGTTGGESKCSFTPPTAGEYRLLATGTDAEGRQTVTSDGLWVSGEGHAPWRQDDDARVEVQSDKATYDVGEKATILIQSPFPEAEAWVTVEREGILQEKRLRLKGTATPIEFEIDESMIPNVFVGVVLARGRVGEPAKGDGDPGRPTFRAGYRQLKVVPAEKRLLVEVSPDQPTKRPGDTLKVALRITDRAGKGVRSEATVWAVDKGVLALTGYETPDPIVALFGPRGLSVRQNTNLSYLVPQLAYGEKGREEGGGGGLAQSERVRRKFETTPIFVGAVETGEDGRATVEGKIPDNLTTFRLMAVAVTEHDRAGRGESEVVVNKPVMARPALPRAVRVGDRFAAGVVAHVSPAAGTTIEVTAEVVDGPLTLEGPTKRILQVAPNRGTEVRFNFVATGAGEAKLRFAVTSGNDGDTVEVPLKAHLPVSLETVATYGVTTDQVVEALATPGGVRKGVGGLFIGLSNSALAGIGDDIRGLMDYPYGCLEQQTSRLVPFVAGGRLLRELGEKTVADSKEVVEKTIATIVALQHGDGGFKYWPDSTCSSYWASTYATLALGEAARAGYSVPVEALIRAKDYLIAQWEKAAPCEWESRHPEAQAFASYVLARLGKPMPGHNEQLFARRVDLALFGKALLAQSIAAAKGPKTQTDALLRDLLNAAQITEQDVRFVEHDPETYATLFHSDGRTSAIALGALMALQPEHPFVPKVVRFLRANRQDGRWPSTQETAFNLMALADYAQRYEKGMSSFVGRIALGGLLLEQVSFTEALATKDLMRTMSELPPPEAGQQKLTFGVEGDKGRLYYVARLRYAPETLPTDPLDQGIAVQRWYAADGTGAMEQTRSVSEGELVRVFLRVATAKQRHYVAIEDPLPGGLEAVDTTLKTTARTPGSDPQQGSHELGGGVAWWYSAFNHVEMRDDRVLLFADQMPPGVHTYTYLARATTAGTFVLKSAQAEEMYAPEVFGRSSGGTFWVHPRAVVGVAQ